ncbi:MAG: hypothetical protein Kow0063_10020 [Anaerolineae bacterium]
MRALARIRWLLLVLVIGLSVVAIRLPDPALDQVLADEPPTADEVQVAEADTSPLVIPPLTELLAEETVTDNGETPGATAQIDTSTQGTY